MQRYALSLQRTKKWAEYRCIPFLKKRKDSPALGMQGKKHWLVYDNRLDLGHLFDCESRTFAADSA